METNVYHLGYIVYTTAVLYTRRIVAKRSPHSYQRPKQYTHDSKRTCL